MYINWKFIYFQYKYSQKKRVYFKPVNSNDFHHFFKLVQTISYPSVCLEL